MDEEFRRNHNFLHALLGFTCREYNEDWNWASLCKDEIQIMLSYPSVDFKEEIGFSGSLYFQVNEVENLWNDLKSKVEIVYDLELFEWGMLEFAIKDNNGYIIQFGEKTDNKIQQSM